MLWAMPEKLRATLGVFLVTGAAYLLAKVFAGHDVKVFLPLWFVVVLVVLAVRYGIAAGVIGSLLSAAIFAMMLFSPVGSLRVSDHAARQNIAWMVLGGVALSCLFAPSGSAHNKS
jgi:K+-sensing histidine kinase KdpD